MFVFFLGITSTLIKVYRATKDFLYNFYLINCTVNAPKFDHCQQSATFEKKTFENKKYVIFYYVSRANHLFRRFLPVGLLILPTPP